MPQRQKPKIGESYTRQSAIECRVLGGDIQQYEISFSSEDPVKQWFGDEILSHDAGAVDLQRLCDVGTFLYSHGKDPNIGRMPIGKIEKAWLDEGQHKCRAIVSFDSDDETAVKLRNKLEKGIIKGVSVGYQVSEWLCLEKDQRSLDGRFLGPADIGVKWQPYEISLEPVPADATVGFGKSIENDEKTQEERTMPEGTMTTTATTTTPALTLAPATPAPAVRSAEEILSEERTRCREIQTLCRGFDISPDEFITSGKTIEETRTAVLMAIEKRGAPIKSGMGGDVTVTRDAEDKHRAAAVDGMILRSGARPDKPAEGARSFQGMTLRDLAVDCLARSGISGAHRMGNDELFKRSLTPDSGFSAITSAIVSTAMGTAYNAAPTTYQSWTARGTAKDFKPTKVMQISEAGELKEIAQNGEFTFDEISDAHMATRQLLTFGKQFGFTRQAFINDDLDVLTKLPAAYVRGARRGINKAVYAILNANPIMGDANRLFSTGHKNLGAAGEPGTETYAEARSAMRRQTNLRGEERLNIAPKFVLSPTALEVANRKMLVSLSDPSAVNAGVANIFQNSMELIVDAELDSEGGANANYFAASPFDIDTIEVSYLNGNDMPTLESKTGFDFLGLQYRIFIDYGITLVDWRGLFMTPEK